MSDERLKLADEYEAGLRKMESAGYEEFGPTIEKHKLVIAALRAPSPSGSAGAMREALEQRKKEIAADIERFDWKPPTPAWHRAFGELSGINFALAAAPQAQEDELYRIRDLIASHIACEKDCQEMPSGCGCAVAAARAVVTRPHHRPEGS